EKIIEHSVSYNLKGEIREKSINQKNKITKIKEKQIRNDEENSHFNTQSFYNTKKNRFRRRKSYFPIR
ncbi:MAG: hypothetical protein II447_12270, partial [Bacteroidaceae bacterium]|nr:hypothetical protein [Bacteroidaceae bacterium]